MGNIIQGSELSCYKTVAIRLGQSKKENNNGVKSNYIVLSVKNKKSMLSGTRNIPLFDDDIPGAFECLKDFASKTADANGLYLVNLAEFKKSEFGQPGGEWEGLLEFPGGMVVEYPLAKGECYQNDVDGNRIIVNGQPVTRKSINVFVQVDLIKPGPDGTMQTVYIDKFGLSEQGQRLEQRFYREAVAKPVVSDDVVVLPPEQSTAPAGTTTITDERPF